ncbi:ABC transporter ATP-binding protein [Methanoregula sp.]|uniref:ABC transporter ATP-binding protein n=1 Tax=Methanoregula sp. TaxID=2052170 RepID=UPI003565F9C8
MTLLEISDLSVRFETRSGVVPVIDTISLGLDTGERTAIIGESGCGKTVLGMSVMRLLPPNARVCGSIRYAGRDLLQVSEPEMQHIRGKNIALVSQNSSSSLNPVVAVGDQIEESLALHGCCTKEQYPREIASLLEDLGFEHPEKDMQKYPHQFSGGMRERVMIAMALACNPDLIIADEPTSGLDPIVKAQILVLLKKVLSKRTLLLITHDLGTAWALASWTAVLYAGEIVEYGPTREVFALPLHPYTQGLIASLPSAGFHPIPGMSPPPGAFPPGCRFYPRCCCATDRCKTDHPPMKTARKGRLVRCFRYD